MLARPTEVKMEPEINQNCSDNQNCKLYQNDWNVVSSTRLLQNSRIAHVHVTMRQLVEVPERLYVCVVSEVKQGSFLL